MFLKEIHQLSKGKHCCLEKRKVMEANESFCVPLESVIFCTSSNTLALSSILNQRRLSDA